MRIAGVALIPGLAWWLWAAAAAADPAGPDALVDRYAEVLGAGPSLRLVSSGTKDGTLRAVFASADRSQGLTLERIACDRTYCDALYERHLAESNARLKSARGGFDVATATEFAVEWKTAAQRHDVVVAKLPRAVMVWTRVSPVRASVELDRWRAAVFAAADRDRFEDARSIGSVELGRWAPQVHRHARALLDAGKMQQASAVLEQVVAWSPYSFEAQLDFADSTLDPARSQASALAVWQNAESPALVARAARLLGRSEPSWESLPVIDPDQLGLRVVLVPLPPCDVRLVEEAGNLLAQALDVPVQLARLPAPWQWGVPDRFHRERDARGFLQRATGRNIDFAGWTPERYARELQAAAAKADPLTRFHVASFIAGMAGRPGQYRMDERIVALFRTLQPLRGADPRTMYVGVTEADLYLGEANFNFSVGWLPGNFGAAVLSYARMEAASTNEPFESRRRLVERMARELVPPALQQLRIPRPADPADPYSYSDSLERVGQKTLTLSAPTRSALDSFRHP